MADPLFAEGWYHAGVVTRESAAEFERLAMVEPTRPRRYWRWQAFCEFTTEHSPLSPELCRRLYALGLEEAAAGDANLGGAIIAHILLEGLCPEDLRLAEATNRNSPRSPRWHRR